MRFQTGLLTACAFLLAACAEDADPWLSDADRAAVATPGVRSLIATHERHRIVKPTYVELDADPDAEPRCVLDAAPAIVEVTPGEHGAMTVGTITVQIDDPGSPCDGLSNSASAVYYEGLTDAVYDTVVYRELLAPADPDVVHRLHLRVR